MGETTTNDEIREAVRVRYGAIATGGSSGCCSPGAQVGCCATGEDASSSYTSGEQLGYTPEQLSDAPSESNLGLGCGNPQAIAALKTGEAVLDLGSGAGFDCFLASRHVGGTGKVIGVDMTSPMIKKALQNAGKGHYQNVEFRLGEIEHLPVADSSVDVIISNCVINLSPDKPAVYQDAFRVLKPGGRLAISDIVTRAAIPEALKKDMNLFAGCVSGASSVAEVREMLAAAGFIDIQVTAKDNSRKFIKDWVPGMKMERFIVSASIEARKPH